MRNKRKWEAAKVSLGAVVVRCSVDLGAEGVLAASYMVLPSERRRIDYDPWRVILHLSRLLDALQSEDQ